MKMDWFASFVKTAGASFPGTASLVQFLSEIESNELQERISKLEDPISSLHPDIQKSSYPWIDKPNINIPKSSHPDTSKAE